MINRFATWLTRCSTFAYVGSMLLAAGIVSGGVIALSKVVG